MSGVFQRNDETSVLTLLRDIDLLGQCPPVICEDVWATLATASLDAGAVVMASTGSNVFLRDRMQRYVRIGGWGSELGDLGSGYHIGKMAIRAILDLKQANPPPAAGGE
jgi:N-acetylglucosamine kinase-like BadF-type ATPase